MSAHCILYAGDIDIEHTNRWQATNVQLIHTAIHKFVDTQNRAQLIQEQACIVGYPVSVSHKYTYSSGSIGIGVPNTAFSSSSSKRISFGHKMVGSSMFQIASGITKLSEINRSSKYARPLHWRWCYPSHAAAATARAECGKALHQTSQRLHWKWHAPSHWVLL